MNRFDFKTAVLAVLTIVPSPFAAAGVQDCQSTPITVSAKDLHDARRACDIALATDTRLRALGLEITEPVVIEVTEDLDVGQGVCVGLYSTREKKLQVLPMECLEDQPGRSGAFPAMSADVLFESVIIHELTHAYVDQHSSGHFLPRIAHEYLAYAVQLDALPENERMRILDKAGVAVPFAFDTINEALLNFAPLNFAAKAWVHFDAEGGDAALVERIIRGDLLFNSLWE